MRKRMRFVVAAVLLVCGAAPAQDAKKTGDQHKSETTGAKEMSKKSFTITGTLGVDGLTLLGEKDNKTYKVINPDFLKENAGQRVRVSAHVSKDNTEIQVSSVMVQSEVPLVANKGDAAFRR